MTSILIITKPLLTVFVILSTMNCLFLPVGIAKEPPMDDPTMNSISLSTDKFKKLKAQIEAIETAQWIEFKHHGKKFAFALTPQVSVGVPHVNIQGWVYFPNPGNVWNEIVICRTSNVDDAELKYDEKEERFIVISKTNNELENKVIFSFHLGAS